MWTNMRANMCCGKLVLHLSDGKRYRNSYLYVMSSHPVIFFDGVCNLCNASVQFVIRHDPQSQFQFAAFQSDYAQQALREFELCPEESDTILLLENGKLYDRSSAALRIARRLTGAWSWLYGFYIVPKFIRDFVYRQISKNRYKIWGKQESCWVPTPALQERFLS